MAAARNDLVSNAWKRGLVGYRILVEHLDLYYKSPLLSKFLRNFVEIVDILEYNWIQKGLFKFPNGISSRLSTNSVVERLQDAHKLLCTALYKEGQTGQRDGRKDFFFSLSRGRRPYEAMDPCYQERCWALFFHKWRDPGLFETFQDGGFA